MSASNAVLNQATTRSTPERAWSSSEAQRARKGAFLFLIEPDKELEILAAIRAAYGGEISLEPTPSGAPVRTAPTRSAWSVPPEALTPRETDVLRLLARGNTNRQAAGFLGLSVRTVENHRANLLSKLGVVSRAEIVSYALDHDLV